MVDTTSPPIHYNHTSLHFATTFTGIEVKHWLNNNQSAKTTVVRSYNHLFSMLFTCLLLFEA